ncbi:MAG: four helix bundle protein [candidate division Zixibacteria bacterium]|nr:four helix bundle protein [Candidatus Tariuqbacter arcticus]
MEKLFKKIEDIEIWKRSCRLAVEIYKLTGQGPFDKDWGLRDQIRRAAVSIPSNIAEGFERESSAEFKRFLLIAKGSCGELRTQLYIAQALGYIAKLEVERLIGECIEISSMISSLISHLRKQKKSK